MSVGGFTPCRQLGSYSRRKQVWTYSVLVENKFGLLQVLGASMVCLFVSDRIYEMRCPFVAVGPNARFIVLPHRDNSCVKRIQVRGSKCRESEGSWPRSEFCLFVCGISLTSGQLVIELFPNCTRSCFSQVVLRRRGGDCIYEMRCLFVAVEPNARFIVLPHWDNMS